MKSSSLVIVAIFLFSVSVYSQTDKFNPDKGTSDLPHFNGSPQNSDYLYVTAGNRIYCIGNQGGKFPDIGFHIPGKMDGIWQQPHKLPGGFSLSLKDIKTEFHYKTIYDSFITSKEKAMKIIDEALLKRIQPKRNEWAGIKLHQLREEVIKNTYPNKGYLAYYNSSGMQPMETGITDTIRAQKMLKSVSFFTNKFGE